MEKFKTSIRLTFAAMCCLVFFACEKNEAESQAENDNFIPRIFTTEDNNPFPMSADSILILDVGQEFQISGLQYSPSDRVSISWTVNDVEVSTGMDYTFVSSEVGEYRIRLEVSHDGVTTSRYRDVLVVSNTASYERKPYTKVVLSYLTPGVGMSRIRNLRWDDLTHIAYKGATVTPSGMVDYTPALESRKIDYLVGKAHTEGVPVLLGISGNLSADGWNVYASADFASRLGNPADMQAIAQSVASFVTYYNMDGVEIRMSDVGHDTDPIYYGAVQGLIGFVDQLRSLLGSEAIITLSVPSPTLNRATGAYSTWVTRAYTPASLASILSQVDWLNIRAYSQSGYWGGTNVIGQPSSNELMVAGVNHWKNLVPTNKLVMGMPGFGIRHLQTTTNANGDRINNGWGDLFFNFIPYRDIVAQVSGAYNEDYTSAIAQGVYYNGVPTVTQKAQFLKDQDVLGAYLWAGDYDADSDQHSLTRAISETLK